MTHGVGRRRQELGSGVETSGSLRGIFLCRDWYSNEIEVWVKRTVSLRWVLGRTRGVRHEEGDKGCRVQEEVTRVRDWGLSRLPWTGDPSPPERQKGFWNWVD